MSQPGVFAVADPGKAGPAAAIAALQRLGVEVVTITGDNAVTPAAGQPGSAGPGVTCSWSDLSRHDSTGAMTMVTAAYQVTGMTCEHRAHAVSEELKNPRSATGVTVTSEVPVAEQAVAAALDEAGMGTPASGTMTSRATRVRHQLGA